MDGEASMKANQIRQLSFNKYCILLALFFIFSSGIAHAKVKGQCSNCHTMHNSENGSVLITSGPNQALLRQDCVGCHTGDNEASDGASSANGTPFVHYTEGVDHYGETGTEVTSSTLAGGTFHFIETLPATGHNVAGIDKTGGAGIIPPGYNPDLPYSAGAIPGDGTWDTQQITCAGIYGCHGTHDTENQFIAVRGGHHQGVNGGKIEPVNNDAASGYRMLVGIAGYEDSDWEYRPDSSNHNQYRGSTTPGQTADQSTISYLCAQCHGQFHSPIENISNLVDGGSPWLRHPTEYSMVNSGEYANYGGNDNSYQVATPLASSSTHNVDVVSTIGFTNDSIVTCISCHRAHGSPYYKLMRWDYAGDSSGGLCVNCHTSKS